MDEFRQYPGSDDSNGHHGRGPTSSKVLDDSRGERCQDSGHQSGPSAFKKRGIEGCMIDCSKVGLKKSCKFLSKER
jgi:hypothetical protein